MLDISRTQLSVRKTSFTFKKMIQILVFLTVMSSLHCRKVSNTYEDSITFTVFNNSSSTGQVTTFVENLTTHGCDADGNFAIVVHGWKESISTPWVMETIDNLVKYRGGCVIFIDYSNYSMVSDYFNLTPHFHQIAKLLLRKVVQIGNYDKLFMYGFSFGSRLCFEVGAKLGHQMIDRIDACDPAGPGFSKHVDPQSAAKNVACINTSTDKGTSKYNCHQNFLMGKCGKSQVAAGKKPLRSHGLCPYFYNSAFTNEFKAVNSSDCKSKLNTPIVAKGLRMGYFSTLTRPLVYGVIYVPTSKSFPWNEISTDILTIV